MLTGTNISCARGSQTLCSGLSFSLKAGEQLAVQGANGSGKSTLLRLLSGFISPKKDTLFWNGEMVSRHNLNFYQQNLLYRGHSLSLHLEASVGDQVRLWRKLYMVPCQDMERALSQWGVGAYKHKKIYQLSQGQQKRLSLSQCSWLKRSLWILDEPEVGLDQKGQRLLAEVFAKHLHQGGSIIHATHREQLGCQEIML